MRKICMKSFGYLVALIVLFCGCGASSDECKNYKSLKILKDGSVSLIDELLAGTKLPDEYHKVYLKKDGRVVKSYYLSYGQTKRNSTYSYNKDGKISEVAHYEEGKYNGVSKYVYKADGNIEKEMVYDRNLNYMFSKKY
jgi:antitoxin component YwqK of YwqJK toxin-antitoxin module